MNLVSSINRFNGKRLIICLLFSTVCFPHAFSQFSEGGIPPSFNYPQTLRNAISATIVPVDFYSEDLREKDEWQARLGVPLQVSKLIPVDLNMENSGYYTRLPGGESIWRLQLKAKDAVAMMLYYNDFYIPEGGRLFIYNADKSQVLGAYTHRTYPTGGRFATEFVGGDELVLEYVVSETSAEKPRISINDIGYGYNMAALREFCGITTRATSGNCNVNINCEEGLAWQNEKKSVCYTIQRIADKGLLCTGALLNNTAEDFKPMILMAAHCAFDGTQTATPEDMEYWMFYFNRERENCSNSSIVVSSSTMTGCKLLANTGMARGSDGLLVQLKDEIPEHYGVFFSGWDWSGDAALSGVNIHHPEGDYKKISTFDEPAVSTTFISVEFTGDSYAHWNVIFKATTNGHGITEKGSSGSPLFNENKLVVGTLTGGSSSCSYLRGLNIYGKMNNHWNKYKTDSTTRMDVWLDPLNKGVTSLSGRFRVEFKPSPRNLQADNLGQSISLSWDAPDYSETPKYYNVYRNNAKINESKSLEYIDNEPVAGSLVYAVSAVYANDEESGFATTSFLNIKYKAPSGIKAQRENYTSAQVNLSWNAPLYEQTIYWGTLLPLNIIGYEDKTPFYFGQHWSAAEIAPFNTKTIKAVEFIPYDKSSFEIFISQGEHTYRQPINKSSLKLSAFNTIPLNTPFVIDGSDSLIVAIYVSDVNTDFPAVCDNGPAVNGKGNIVSFDGIEWEQLNDGEEPEDFNYNFILTVTVSSQTGVLPVTSKSARVAKPDFILNENPSAQINVRKATLPFNDYSVSLRSAVPAAFPEVTKYRVYLSGLFSKDILPPDTSCTDDYLNSSHFYEVSAFYGTVESDKSEKANITTVGNDYLPQTSFKAYFINQTLRIESPESESIVIYSAMGAQIYSVYKNDFSIDIPIPFQNGSIFFVKGSKSGTIKVLKIP